MKKLLLIALLIVGCVFGTTINVPADSLTIQAGINGAEEGDTVLVAAGTYVENIVWVATNGIKLIGSGKDDCFIDGDSLASVIRFEEDLGGIIDSTTLITGFTIQNGNAQDDYPFPRDRGGGMYIESSNPTLINSILWDNSHHEIYFGQYFSTSSITIISSDIQDGEAGIVTNDSATVYLEEGNIDDDPLFCDPDNGDFTLAENSPCIGTGKDGANMGSLGVGCEEILDIKDNVIPNTYAMFSYPNPFNPTTKISFSIPEFGLTTITAYDITGRKLEMLTNEVLSIGNYSINWDASSYPSGVYLIRMDSGEFTQTQKVALVK